MKIVSLKKQIKSSIILVVSVLASVGCTNTREIKSSESAFFAEIHQEIQGAMEQHSIPGVSIAIVDRHKILWAESFGTSDRSSGVPVTSETLFSIQSMSKTFTATAVMLAVQEGLVTLDTPISEYLPDFAIHSRFEDNPERLITLRHLLSHTAGFTHEAPVGNNYNSSSPSFDAHVESISDTWLRYPVGSRYSYSNLGIDLAGYVIQEASGVPFETYMKERLLSPLGMKASFVDTPLEHGACSNCAKGHWTLYRSLPDYIPLTASGGVRVNAIEGGRFIQFHLNHGTGPNGELLDSSYLAEMYAPHFEGTHYGLGVGVHHHEDQDTYMLVHGGGGFGYSSLMGWCPEYGFGFIVLVNSSDDTDSILNIAHDVFGRMVAKKLISKREESTAPSYDVIFGSTRKEIASKDHPLEGEKSTPFEESWNEYVGRYQFAFGGGFRPDPLADMSWASVDVFEENGFLRVSGSPAGEHRLIEYLPGLFFTTSGEALDFRGKHPTWRNIKLIKDDRNK